MFPLKISSLVFSVLEPFVKAVFHARWHNDITVNPLGQFDQDAGLLLGIQGDMV